MKLSVLLFLIFSSYCCFSQSVRLDGSHSFKTKPAIFLDGVRIGEWSFNPEKIKSLDIGKNFVEQENNVFGAIYITSKNPKDFNFLDLIEIKRKHAIEANGPTILMLDREFIEDLGNFRIDSAYLASVEVIKGTEFKDLKDSVPNLSIIKIYTKAKGNEKPFRIKGSGTNRP